MTTDEGFTHCMVLDVKVTERCLMRRMTFTDGGLALDVMTTELQRHACVVLANIAVNETNHAPMIQLDALTTFLELSQSPQVYNAGFGVLVFKYLNYLDY
jgi:hypothetical protein